MLYYCIKKNTVSDSNTTYIIKSLTNCIQFKINYLSFYIIEIDYI